MVDIKPLEKVLLNNIADKTKYSLSELEDMFQEEFEKKGDFLSKKGIIASMKEKLVPDEEKENNTNNIKNIKKGVKEMELDSFFEELETETEEFPDFLRIQNDVVFKLKLVDPSKKPRGYTDSYDNEKWAFDVLLLDISPEEAEDEYVINKKYSLSLGKRATRRFKEFWIANDNQYEEPFEFQRTGRGYQTDYEFKIA